MDSVTNFDLAAEQATLGAMLMSGPAIDAVIEVTAPRDFLRPAHQVIAQAIIAMHAADEPVDPIAIADQLARDGDIGRVGGAPYLHTLMASVPTVANAGYYARIVAEYAARRRIEEAGTRMVQRARQLDGGVEDILAGAESDLAAAITQVDAGTADPLTIAEFCDKSFDLGAPVIPGVLDAAERVIIVAGEGMGKSTLGRQIAVATAAGVHPFTLDPISPMRTLNIDLENPPGLVQRKTRPLMEIAARQPDWNPDRALLWCRPGGLDLSAAADQAQLRQVIKRSRPDLVVIGPLYKMVRDRGERAEQLHGAAAGFLDQLRERFGVALWIEAHAPMAQNGVRDMRPLGSSIWQRWPEFGISLRKADTPNTLLLGKFRGDRDERQWPEKLTRSRWGGSCPWPWEAIYPANTFRQMEG